ncbi:MAG: chloride channel protein [Deferrisomatales bacterium]|nr:chloride channel protein [Deferrisomatales bacterium]
MSTASLRALAQSALLRLHGLRPSENTALLAMAVAVGLLAGVGNLAFRRLIDLFHFLVFQEGGQWLGVHTGFPAVLLLPLLPTAGAVLLAPLDLFFPGEIRGYGLPRFLEAVNLKGAVFRARAMVGKSLAAAITIGTGGSAGMEGPIAAIGGALGSLVGQGLRVSHERLRTLVACGVAAGVGGTFNAPIAGVFFAQEIVLLRSFEATSFTPIVISSAIGTLVTRAVEGNHPAFRVPHYALHSPWEVIFYAILGVIVGLAAVHFIRSFYALADRFAAWRAPERLKPIAGAFATGVVGIALPQVLGNGYEHVELALAGQMGGLLLLVVAAAKVYATGLTLGSGNAGGVFAPSLFVGAMLGGAYGTLVTALFPGTSAGPGAYALVGMGGFLAAATHAPMTAIFLIFEMTHEYSVILPIMVACVIGYTVSRYFQKDSIDTLELARRGIHLEEGREVSVLQAIQAGDVMNPGVEGIPEGMPLREILQFIPRSRHMTFPVVDAQGRLAGILSLQDFREIAYEEGLEDLVVAGELATREVITVFPDESLRDALGKIGVRNFEHLPVVSREDPRRILGMLSRRDIVTAYNKALIDRSLRGEEA